MRQKLWPVILVALSVVGYGDSGVGSGALAAVRAADLPADCVDVQLAFQMMPDAPKDVGVPLPDGAVFFGGNPGGTMRVNRQEYTQLPMARFLVALPMAEVVHFYQERLDGAWSHSKYKGLTFFAKGVDLPKGKNPMSVLMEKPGSVPSITFMEVEKEPCAQSVKKGARTMVEIVFEK